MRTFIASMVLVATAHQALQGQQRPARPDADSQAFANLSPELLGLAGRRPGDLQAFADAIVRELLVAAAAKIGEQKLDTEIVSVTLDFKIRALSEGVPSPREINVCWELSSGLQSYVTCVMGGYAPRDAREVSWWCDTLEDALEAAKQRNDQVAAARNLRLLVRLGCVAEERPSFNPRD